MSFTFIDDPRQADELSRALAGADRIALDCEAAGFHRYSDRLCLVQITVDDRTWIVDPLAFDPTDVLKGPLEDPDLAIVMHGADFDLRLLDRDLGIHLKGLFDTQAAAALLGERALGLASLLEEHLGVRLSKKYQRADWARRPLPDDMLEYAAADTRHLDRLADLLRERLGAAQRSHWAEEEFRELETIRWEEPEEEDPVTRVKGARDLDRIEVAALREALEWRDDVARERDRAPFRVAGDRSLLEVAQRRPTSVQELRDVKGLNARLASTAGPSLLERIDRLGRLDPGELEPYPRPERNGPGRPPPEIEELADRLRRVRNHGAERLGLDRGTLLPNAVLLTIAQAGPTTPDELARVEGMKGWQVEALGDEILAELKKNS